MKTAEAQQMVDTLVATLGDCFMDGNCVQLANFGGVEVKKKLERIIEQFGYDARQSLALHVNFGVLEDDCCRTSFLRGAFLSGGSVTVAVTGESYQDVPVG